MIFSRKFAKTAADADWFFVAFLFLAFSLFWLFQIDWSDLSSKKNSGAFFGVLAGIMIIISLQIKNKDKKELNH